MKIQNSKLKIFSSGMTIVEMLIGIAVLIVLLGMITTFIIRAFYVNRYSYEQGLNTAAMQNSLRSFVTNLREAKQSDAGEYMITVADDYEITFFANIDDDDATERLHYYLEDEQLKMGVSEPSGFPLAYGAGDDEVRVVGNGIVNTAGQPVFYYYNQDYPVDTTNNPLSTPTSPSEVGMIKIDIYANVDAAHSPDSAHIETLVRPRNIR